MWDELGLGFKVLFVVAGILGVLTATATLGVLIAIILSLFGVI